VKTNISSSAVPTRSASARYKVGAGRTAESGQEPALQASRIHGLKRQVSGQKLTGC
jgi:hypothetical protein